MDQPRALTPRQREVLALYASGYGRRDVACKLSIAPGTVKMHLESIRERLGAHSLLRAGVVALASGEIELCGDRVRACDAVPLVAAEAV